MNRILKWTHIYTIIGCLQRYQEIQWEKESFQQMTLEQLSNQVKKREFELLPHTMYKN